MADARARAERAKSGVPSRDVQKTDENQWGRDDPTFCVLTSLFVAMCDRVLRDVRKTRRGESGLGGPFRRCFITSGADASSRRRIGFWRIDT